ncbi:hypothetical protein Ais01nite_62950 [Asanoa ishikariensis]|uniref:PpGpp synthetase catalytic domain-containing protein (RelA/SpoT-type nucleotidyltranferase) n=1 Tax=Asanoa ishikariensis TaxID=137265 RepID=A0A1H3NY89_9ACTN|nr:hypothetical protein [Asanoa ishikariensis]GIF68260.1 hypothetical protein Ais01nite_62950 [Asanoa ishikariensis]SDY93771.1 ppGpp synthetase catalytic domain-containing protein (RelA/SpoT-type nucleotidyltranferase) [Asanoa ishikariensis]
MNVAEEGSQVVAQYAVIRPQFVDFAVRIEGLLRDLLTEATIDVIQLESRAKAVDSFEAKIRSKGGKYKDPLGEMTDLAGVRVITYYLEDVETVETLIKREFAVDLNNSIDKSAQLDPDRFGYLSRHFVVSIKSPRSDLPEWVQFKDLKAEVQVRTALQHAWAAVNHKLEYKSVEEVPRELKRGLGRLSALFEIADSQFSYYRKEGERIAANYESSLAKGDFDLELDLSSLVAVLENAEIVSGLMQAAANANQVILPDDGNGGEHALFIMLRELRITSVAQLLEWLREASGDMALVEAARDTGTARMPVDLATFIANMLHIAHPEIDGTASELFRISINSVKAARKEYLRKKQNSHIPEPRAQKQSTPNDAPGSTSP